MACYLQTKDGILVDVLFSSPRNINPRHGYQATSEVYAHRINDINGRRLERELHNFLDRLFKIKPE